MSRGLCPGEAHCGLSSALRALVHGASGMCTHACTRVHSECPESRKLETQSAGALLQVWTKVAAACRPPGQAGPGETLRGEGLAGRWGPSAPQHPGRGQLLGCRFLCEGVTGRNTALRGPSWAEPGCDGFPFAGWRLSFHQQCYKRKSTLVSILGKCWLLGRILEVPSGSPRHKLGSGPTGAWTPARTPWRLAGDSPQRGAPRSPGLVHGHLPGLQGPSCPPGRPCRGCPRPRGDT